MKIVGWEKKYNEILQKFGYDRRKDLEAALFLNSLLKRRFSLKRLQQKIEKKTVFVIGAGPSLFSSVRFIKKFKKVTKIAADGSTKALLQNGIRPDIVVTDLDGELEFLKKAANGNSIMVVHSHGDNIGRLPIALSFRNCIGTTEGKSFGKIENFGGFTDGDRCVFLANHFGAKRVILFGMDFGEKVGRYSKEKKFDRSIKIKKLRMGKKLLEWLTPKGSCEWYTTSHTIKGYKKIKFKDIGKLV